MLLFTNMFIFLFQFLDYYFRFFFGLARSELFLFLYLYTCFGESFFLYQYIFIIQNSPQKSSSFPVALLTDIHSLDCNKFKNVVGLHLRNEFFGVSIFALTKHCEYVHKKFVLIGNSSPFFATKSQNIS